jgi:hypothetical protein
MNSFNDLDLDNLEVTKANYKHRRAFEAVTDNNALINGKYFFANRAEIKKYIKEIPFKITKQNETTPSIEKVRSDQNFDGHMLNFFLIGDKYENPSKLGLLTTLVDGSGSQVLYSTYSGEGKYLLFEAQSNIKFPDSSEFDKMEAVVQHVDKIDELDDRLFLPEDFYNKAADSSENNFQSWLKRHKIGSCLSNYKSYIKAKEVEAKNIELAMNYVSIWEMKDLLSDTYDEEWIGIFPIVMKSTSATRFPKSAHFMSLLFVPLDGEVEGEGFSIKNINSSNPFVLSSKGYPRKWTDNKELALMDDCIKKTFKLSKF